MANVGYYPQQWAGGCDPRPDCVGSRCCANRVPVSGAELPPPVPTTPLNPATLVPGDRGEVTGMPVLSREQVPGVETGWTTRCDNGMCADTTSSVSVGGLPLGHISPGKTVNNFVMPADTFAARRMMMVSNRERGGALQTQTQQNLDWANQGISSLRSSPEFQQEVANLRPLFGDAAEAVATRRMTEAEGMTGAYNDSAYLGADNKARQDMAQVMQSGAMANRNSDRMFAALGADPSAFDGQAIGYDSNGLPFVMQRQADGGFDYADSPVPMTVGDYGVMAQGTNSVTQAYGTALAGERLADGKAALAMGKEAGATQRAQIRANTSRANNAASNAVRLAALKARGMQLAAKATGRGSSALTFAERKELDLNREEQKRITQMLYLQRSGKYTEPEAASAPRL